MDRAKSDRASLTALPRVIGTGRDFTSVVPVRGLVDAVSPSIKRDRLGWPTLGKLCRALGPVTASANPTPTPSCDLVKLRLGKLAQRRGPGLIEGHLSFRCRRDHQLPHS